LGENQDRIDFDLGRASTYFSLFHPQHSERRDTYFKQAETSFLRAIKLSPINARYRFALGDLYARWGRIGEASKRFETATLLEPQNLLYRYRLAASLMHLGDKEKAQDLFKETLVVNGNYLKRILASVISATGRDAPDNFHNFMIRDEFWQQYQSRIASFFHARQDLEAAQKMLQLSF